MLRPPMTHNTQRKRRRYTSKSKQEDSNNNRQSTSATTNSSNSNKSATWKRVSVNPSLLSYSDMMGSAGMSGLIMLEEISGKAFTQLAHIEKYQPDKQYGEDTEQEQEHEEEEEEKHNKKKHKTNLNQFVPQLQSIDNIDDDDTHTLEAQEILQQINQEQQQEEQQTATQEEQPADEDAREQESVSVLSPPSLPSPSPSPSAWDVFSLHPLLLSALHSLHFSVPTPIQSACLPVAITQWKDIIAAAETGSGKTLAFGLPILNHLLQTQQAQENTQKKQTRKDWTSTVLSALILTPTRELALQITHHLQRAAQYSTIRIVSIVGGISTQKQERLLCSHPHIVVATPGRLYELLINQSSPHLSVLHHLRFLVLDEADRMVANGHFPELEKIIQIIHKQRHRQQQHTIERQDDVFNDTMPSPDPASRAAPSDTVKLRRLQHFFFSATLTLPEQGRENMNKTFKKKKKTQQQTNDDDEAELEKQRMIQRLLDLCQLPASRPAILDLTSTQRTVPQLTELSINCLDADKDFHVYAFILAHPQDKVIIFVNAISCVRRLSSLLSLLSLSVYPLHAEMQQRQRLKNLERFRQSPSAAYLVCSDVAARGLDIPAVPIVLHYQLPHNTETYIHRCGRTARAGQEGMSIALLSEHDSRSWNRIWKVVHNNNQFDAVSKYHQIPHLMSISHGRMSVARKLDKQVNSEQSKRASHNWFKKHAAEMDIEIEEEILHRLNENENDDDSGNVNTHKNKKAQVRQLQQELNKLLQQPVDEQPQHKRFFTLNIAEQMNQTEETQRRRQGAGVKRSRKSSPSNEQTSS